MLGRSIATLERTTWFPIWLSTFEMEWSFDLAGGTGGGSELSTVSKANFTLLSALDGRPVSLWADTDLLAGPKGTSSSSSRFRASSLVKLLVLWVGTAKLTSRFSRDLISLWLCDFPLNEGAIMLNIRRNIYYLKLVTQKSYLNLEIVKYICKFYFAPLCTFLFF